MSFGCGPRGEAQSILEGEGDGFFQVWVVVSLVGLVSFVNLSLFMAHLNTKSASTMH
jgi:hypothetical protein